MTLQYIISQRTNGANPFKIFEALSELNQDELYIAIKGMSYPMFLKTSYWFAISSVAKANAGMRCQVCNSKKAIDAHHRTYDTHGMEHRHMNDITVLCGLCHGLFHGHSHELPEAPAKHKEHKKKKRVGFVIPHERLDLSGVPDGDFIVLTKSLINACRANGAFTNATMNHLGVKAPLSSGWVSRLIGTTITRQEYINALEGRYVYRQILKGSKRDSIGEHPAH